MVRQVKGAIRSGNKAVSGATLEVGLPNGWVVGFYRGEDPALYFPQKTRSIFCWESIRTTFLAVHLSVSTSSGCLITKVRFCQGPWFRRFRKLVWSHWSASQPQFTLLPRKIVWHYENS